MSDGTNSATYSYLANSPLIGEISFASNGIVRMTRSNQYDNLSRLTNLVWTAGTNIVASFSYQYNSANQRTRVAFTDGSYWIYQYESLGQLASARRYWADGTAVAGQQFAYGFDDIGNRTNTASGGNVYGSNLRPANYTNNVLNQITSRDVPGYLNILGSSLSNATVTLWGTNYLYVPTTRHADYFRAEVPVTNSATAVWLTLTNMAVLRGTTNFDLITTNVGNVFLQQTPETFGYDPDGNLTNSGRFTFAWDDENRLTNITSLNAFPAAAKRKVDLAYDYLGRRIQKVVSTNNGGYLGQSTNNFIYDGWNLVGILNQTNRLLYSFAWSADLSGSLGGVGGAGGLISMTVYSGTNAGTYFYCFDGNGNVVALVNATGGTIAAQYEYDPFLNVLRATGPLAKINPFLGATKFYDWETALYYFGYRYYDPGAGKWLNRDPLEEQGGDNLYGFVNNNPISAVDVLGSAIQSTCPLDGYFKSLGLSSYRSNYSGGVYTYDYAGSPDAVTGSASAKMVVVRMLQAKKMFKLSHDDGGEVKNLKKQIDARLTIVKNALSANFNFGAKGTTSIDWSKVYQNAQDYFNQINYTGQIMPGVGTYIECQPLSEILFRTGNANLNPGHRDYDGVWIPGDWGYIRNLDYEQHPEHWLNGAWAGENVFHTGVTGQDEMFWGHFAPGQHPSMSEKQWFDDIKNRWRDIDGKPGRGVPKWRTRIDFPTIGLQP